MIKLYRITKITKNEEIIRMKRNEETKNNWEDKKRNKMTRSKSKRKSSWCRRKVKLKGIGSLIDSCYNWINEIY